MFANPKRKAAKRANVRRALSALRQKKNLNDEYLWRANDIVEGKVEITWGLLLHLHEVCDATSAIGGDAAGLIFLQLRPLPKSAR